MSPRTSAAHSMWMTSLHHMLPTAQRHVQLPFERVTRWTYFYMQFSRVRGSLRDQDLYLFGIRLPVVEQTHILDIIFDSCLTWVPHLRVRDLEVACTKRLLFLPIPSLFLESWLYCFYPVSNAAEVRLCFLFVLLCISASPPDSWLHSPCWSQSGNGYISVLSHSQPPCGCRSVISKPTQTDLTCSILVQGTVPSHQSNFYDTVSDFACVRLLCPHKGDTWAVVTFADQCRQLS